MAGVADTNSIDAVATQPDGRALLLIVEEKAWAPGRTPADQLIEKINTYATFVLQGQLVEQHPHVDPERVVILLRCASQPTPDVADVLTAAETGLAAAGIGLSVQVAEA